LNESRRNTFGCKRKDLNGEKEEKERKKEGKRYH